MLQISLYNIDVDYNCPFGILAYGDVRIILNQTFARSSLFLSSSCGFSCWMVTASSWPVRPARVVEKFTMLRRARELGGRSGLGFRVARNSLKKC